MSKWYIRPEAEVCEEYNFLLGYRTGRKEKWYCGIEGIYSVFNGCWSDPEIVYKGYAINVNYLDVLWSQFEEKEPNGDMEAYAAWLRENKDLVFETLDKLLDAYKLSKAA